MMKQIKVMVMGGHTKDFHNFKIMGPIYEKFLSEAGIAVMITEDHDDFLKERLAGIDVIIDYTTGEELTDPQRQGLLDSIKILGKGFVGVHGAADSFTRTEGYLPMIGGKFLMHPSGTPAFTFNIKNHCHPVVQGLNDFVMDEELYLMETYGHFELLMSTWWQGIERPITWVKGYGLGRVCYTALGHGEPQTRNLNFQKLIVNAVRWAKKPE